MKATGQITIFDMNDFVPSPTAPPNPTEGTVWLRTSGSPPYRFFIYTGGVWEPTDYESLAELDPEQDTKVNDSYQAITDLDMDSKITRYERSIVRGELATITGLYLGSADIMPTLTTIDTNQVGDLYAIRKEARDLGVPTTDTTYVRMGNAYDSLRTYLSGMAPKAWDIDSGEVIEVDPDTWDNTWKEYYYSLNLLTVLNAERRQEYADYVSGEAVKEAIAAVSNADQYEETAISNPTIIAAPISSLGLPRFQGRHVDSWEGGVGDFSNGSRIQPIVAPTFYTGDASEDGTNPDALSGTALTLRASFYGDGNINDEFRWDRNGMATKIKRWQELLLDGNTNITFEVDHSGFKRVGVKGIGSPLPIDGTGFGYKYDGTQLVSKMSGASMSGPDEIVVTDFNNALHITIADEDSGWGGTYQPTPEEVAAYFNGWRMCNGTFGVPYDSTGDKVWYPIGDTDLTRSTIMDDETYGSVPTTVSPTMLDGTIYNYQVLYALVDAVSEIVTFDGFLDLVQGDNEIHISYATPVSATIEDGVFKYATNLATVTEDTRSIIPHIQRRLSSAEEQITSNAIINTVMNSVEYELIMQSKADVEAIGHLATKDELTEFSDDVDDRIGNAIDNIDFSPYVTQSQLTQTATDITAKFAATGGMNLLRNSVGYADRNFWIDYDPDNVVETIRSNELDILGFGSGFLFRQGANQGIMQDVSVIPGQPYTFSWYLNKITGGDNENFRFFIQIEEDGAVVHSIADNSAEVTNGFIVRHTNFTPTTGEIRIRLIAYSGVEAIVTGLMLTIGDTPLQWSLATGELYNTNIRMDINGIRVSQMDEEKNEVGFTQITPDEFAGYYDTDGNGTFEKIFYLNGEETVTKKLRAQDEISMGGVKIINVDTPQRKGWAFVPNLE